MSQNVVNYGVDPSGAQLLDDLLTGEQQNRLTMDGGNSRPPYAEIGTIWTDKSVAGKATLKRFNGTSDDVLITIDETTGAITIPGIADTDLSNLSASGNSKFQEPLISGTNIKTINDESLLGSGNITISAGANIALTNSPYTTNRILEIPQNVKVELDNGTVTVKAGSKLTELDGNFSSYTVPSDVSNTYTGSGQIMVMFDCTYNSLFGNYVSKYFSGSSYPTAVSGEYYYFFNTSDNRLYQNAGTTSWSLIPRGTFPLCVITNTSNVTTSIDQIFNGFGYIGSTDFLLSGVKFQIANGQNANGTCITEIKTVDSVLTHTDSRGIYSFYNSTTNSIHDTYSIKIQKSMPSGTYNVWFNPDENQWRMQGGTEGVFTKNKVFPLWKRNVNSSGQITSLDLFFSTVDSFVTSNALNFSNAGRSFIAGMSMPADRQGVFISNSFASSSVFTAPENGYFCLRAGCPAAGFTLFMADTEHLSASNGLLSVGGSYYGVGGANNLILPIKKGRSITAQYDNVNFAYDVFCGLWFIPAEGG